MNQEIVKETEKAKCTHCNGPLNPLFYFCTHCAAPYKEAPTFLTPAASEILPDSVSLRKNAPQATTLFRTLFSIAMVPAFILNLLAPEIPQSLPIVLSSIGITVLTLVYYAKYRIDLKGAFLLKGFANKYFLAGAGGLAVFLFLNFAYHNFIESITGITPEPLGLGTDNKYFEILVIALLPALTEEILFRGLMQKWFSQALSRKKTFLLCAALFGLLHFSIISFPYLFALGLFFSYIRFKTDSLWPVILLHFVHNYIVFTYF